MPRRRSSATTSTPATETFTDEPERGLFEQVQQNFRRFMELDAVAWHALQNSDPARTKRILLGPELRQFETMADTADQLADLEVQQATATENSFDQARDDARKRLIAVALGAGVVIILLLVTANDIARMALEGERHVRGTAEPEPPERRALVTRDVLLTLSLLLGAALAARFLASLVRVPEILVLVLFGALLGPSVLDVVDVPFDSIGAQLLFTLGVSLILFYGGLNLSLDVLQRVWVGLGMLVIPGVVLTAVITGVVAHFAFDLSWTAAMLMGAVLSPTDPAILIPLFIRSRLRPKVAQTVVAESAFNDPTGAVLALALAGVLVSGEGSIATPAREFVVDLGISTVIGIVAGVLLAATISSRRAGIWRESSAAAVLAVVTIGYFSLDSAGGSGYLGAFLAGLIVGNMERLGLAMHSKHERELRQFAFSVADLVTLFVFVVLGANIPFDALGDYLLPALGGPRRAAAGRAADDRARLHPARPALEMDQARGRLPLLDAGDRRRAGGARRGARRARGAEHRRLRQRRRAGDRDDAGAPGAPGRLAGRAASGCSTASRPPRPPPEPAGA